MNIREIQMTIILIIPIKKEPHPFVLSVLVLSINKLTLVSGCVGDKVYYVKYHETKISPF